MTSTAIPLKIVRRAWVYLFLLIFTVIALGPLFLIVNTSLKTNVEIAESPLAPPSTLRLENISNAWTQGRFGQYTQNSLIIAFTTTALVLLVSTMAGFALSVLDLPAKRITYLFFLLGMAIPIHGIIIPQYILMSDLGLLNKPLGVAIALTAVFIPFGVYFMRSFFAGLPSEIADAARVDGCNDIQVLLYVLGPMARPAIGTLLVFIFMWAWNDLLISLVYLTNDSVRTVMVGLTLYQGRFTVDTSLTATGALIACLPVIAVYIIFQRQFMRGIASGAMAGT